MIEFILITITIILVWFGFYALIDPDIRKMIKKKLNKDWKENQSSKSNKGSK